MLLNEWFYSPFGCIVFSYSHIYLPTSSLLTGAPPPPCVVVFPAPHLPLPLVVTGEQLALLQYRLSMSSMPCQPLAPPGSGTLHTYQVLLPFHSPSALWGLLDVNLSQ